MSYSGHISFSVCIRFQGPHARQFKMVEMSSITGLEARSPRSSCQQGWAPSEALGGILSPLPRATGGGPGPWGLLAPVSL